MRIAVLGTGNMGRAMVEGIKARVPHASIVAWDALPASFEKLPAGIDVLPPSKWFAANPPAVILVAVKPQDIRTALASVVQVSGEADCLWCSIAAGVSIATIESVVGSGRRVIRIMPNTPALIGEGASAFAVNAHCTQSDIATVREMLGACGTAAQVAEKLMNAVTGLSGSGPAYVYLFIEALIEGGVTAGLPYATARQLAIQTVRGAAGMALQSDMDPPALKALVMSPGGTTTRGLMALEQGNFKYSVIRAVADATRRAEELGA